MVHTSRTLNTLPFADLEPHRFEELVRQPAYEVRVWKSIEATRRSGSDEVIDIRATERVDLAVEDGDGEDEYRSARSFALRCRFTGTGSWIDHARRGVPHGGAGYPKVVRQPGSPSGPRTVRSTIGGD